MVKHSTQCPTFSGQDSIAVLAFLKNYKRACDETDVSEGAALALLRYFLDEEVREVFQSYLYQDDDCLAGKLGADSISSYPEAVQWSLARAPGKTSWPPLREKCLAWPRTRMRQKKTLDNGCVDVLCAVAVRSMSAWSSRPISTDFRQLCAELWSESSGSPETTTRHALAQATAKATSVLSVSGGPLTPVSSIAGDTAVLWLRGGPFRPRSRTPCLLVTPRRPRQPLTRRKRLRRRNQGPVNRSCHLPLLFTLWVRGPSHV